MCPAIRTCRKKTNKSKELTGKNVRKRSHSRKSLHSLSKDIDDKLLSKIYSLGANLSGMNSQEDATRSKSLDILSKLDIQDTTVCTENVEANLVNNGIFKELQIR